MTQEEIMKQARFIFTTGKMIRNRIFRNYTGHAEGNLCELSLPQIHLVNVTRERGQVTIKELAELLGVSPPSASAMVERLVEKEILVREQSREDRRKVLVSVSPHAEGILQNVETAIFRSFVDLVEKIGPDTARKWCEVLEKVRSVQERELEPVSLSHPAKKVS
jgi:DNA-binding MarR family transcriptional regulator